MVAKVITDVHVFYVAKTGELLEHFGVEIVEFFLDRFFVWGCAFWIRNKLRHRVHVHVRDQQSLTKDWSVMKS